MPRTREAELELIELALARRVSWANIARALDPKMERWEAKRRYRELCRQVQLERAGVARG
jgi:hypothetical protein